MVARRDGAADAHVRGLLRPRPGRTGWLLGVLVTTGSLSLLVLSPLGLVVFADRFHTDWTTIGNIGQAYGAASAVISGVAVVGVALSLYMQARQNKLQQFQCVRAQQLELMKLLMEDPALLAMSVTADRRSRVRWRQGIYINLMFKHLEMQYVTGYAPSGAVATYAAEYFNIDFVRDWWREGRDAYARDACTRQRRVFFRIVDGEYRKATLETLNSGPGQVMGGSRWRWPSRRASILAASVVVVPAALWAATVLGRRRGPSLLSGRVTAGWTRRRASGRR